MVFGSLSRGQVYELASFCRAHRGLLKGRLLLLSLDWPSTWSLFKTASLTRAERQQLKSFSCLRSLSGLSCLSRLS